MIFGYVDIIFWGRHYYIVDPIYILRARPEGAVSSAAGRYIGVTGEGLEKHRLKYHLWEAAAGYPGHKCNWIRSIDGDIVMEVIEGVRPEDREEREKYWISLARAYGHRLTNATDGGEGVSGMTHSDAWRQAMSARRKGVRLSEKHCRAISLGKRGAPSPRKGKTLPLEHCENIRHALLRVAAKSEDMPKGVHWCNTEKKFVAQLGVPGRNLHLGRFRTREAAGLARDIAVFLFCPPGSYLNYPPAAVDIRERSFYGAL